MAPNNDSGSSQGRPPRTQSDHESTAEQAHITHGAHIPVSQTSKRCGHGVALFHPQTRMQTRQHACTNQLQAHAGASEVRRIHPCREPTRGCSARTRSMKRPPPSAPRSCRSIRPPSADSFTIDRTAFLFSTSMPPLAHTHVLTGNAVTRSVLPVKESDTSR